MTLFWRADDAATAVRSHFGKVNWHARAVAYRPAEVAVEGDSLMVTFHYEGYAEVFAVLFSLDRMPEGPQTGEVCESLAEWAEEVDWTLDEELNTCMTQTALRSVTADGLVLLHWRNGSGIR